MASTDPEIMPQARASKAQRVDKHEFCHGYVDTNGIWNNGFYCKRWGRPDDKYCCGDLGERFCCPEPTSSTSRSTTSDPSVPFLISSSAQFPTDGTSILSVDLVPVIIGSGVGMALILCCLLIVCLVCRCCGRGRKRSNQPIPRNKRLSFNVEAEATSAVIAAQALQKDDQQQQRLHNSQQLQKQSSLNHHDSKPHTCNGEDGHLHCGCRWSPSTSRSTVVDLDSLIATMQQNITNSWQHQQAEIDSPLGHPVNCSCDQHRTFNPLLAQNKRLFSASDRPMNGNISPSITMEQFRPPSLTPSSRTHQTYFPLEENIKGLHNNSEQSSLLSERSMRGYTYSPHSQMSELRQLKCLVHECSDRQRRDSGVLVEEPDVIQDTNLPSNFTLNKFPPPPSQLLVITPR